MIQTQQSLQNSIKKHYATPWVSVKKGAIENSGLAFRDVFWISAFELMDKVLAAAYDSSEWISRAAYCH